MPRDLANKVIIITGASSGIGAATAIECAKAGTGLVQLPIYMVKDHLDEGKLMAVLTDTQRQDEHVYYHYPKYRYVQPKVRKFIQFFLQSYHILLP